MSKYPLPFYKISQFAKRSGIGLDEIVEALIQVKIPLRERAIKDSIEVYAERELKKNDLLRGLASDIVVGTKQLTFTNEIGDYYVTGMDAEKIEKLFPIEGIPCVDLDDKNHSSLPHGKGASVRQLTADATLVAALFDALLNAKNQLLGASGKPSITQTKLIEEIAHEYSEYDGISKSTLNDKIPKCLKVAGFQVEKIKK